MTELAGKLTNLINLLLPSPSPCMLDYYLFYGGIMLPYSFAHSHVLQGKDGALPSCQHFQELRAVHM